MAGGEWRAEWVGEPAVAQKNTRRYAWIDTAENGGERLIDA
jgi:hypothetical protein